MLKKDRKTYSLTDSGFQVAAGREDFNRELFDSLFEPEIVVWGIPESPVDISPGSEEEEPQQADERHRQQDAEREAARVSQLAAEHAGPILTQLETMPLRQVYNLYQNAQKMLLDESQPPEKVEAALLVVAAIDAERERRGSSKDPVSAFADGSFRWPSTVVHSGGGGLAIDADDQGLLSTMGYHVGRVRGEAQPIRRRLLTRVFKGDLPDGWQVSWGNPDTAARLRKLAETIAAMTRNAKRRGQMMETAIMDWEDDLSFLHDQFYVGRFDFKWPTTKLSS